MSYAEPGGSSGADTSSLVLLLWALYSALWILVAISSLGWIVCGAALLILAILMGSVGIDYSGLTIVLTCTGLAGLGFTFFLNRIGHSQEQSALIAFSGFLFITIFGVAGSMLMTFDHFGKWPT